MQLVRFMTSPAGRAVRVVLGAVILVLGQTVAQGWPGNIITLVGLVPLAGGLFDFCLIGYALGYPLNGAQARRKLANQ